MCDQSICFCSGVLPELFPELAGIDSDPEENINQKESCFNNLRVRPTESDSSISAALSSSQPESQALINRGISPSFIDCSIESNSTDPGKPDCSKLANCKKGKESNIAVSANSECTKKIQTRPYFDRKKYDRAREQNHRDNRRDLINQLKLNMPEDKLDSIKKTSRLVSFDDTRKNIEAIPYLLKNQANHPLVQKYGAKKLSDCIYGESKLDFPPSELGCFSHLKKKIINAIAAKESRVIKFEYVKLLRSAYKSN
ncbi:hypothetical protein [Endozoicomonas sp.]|uniref:hypothetical protein n=1 Tax=Endozoicomonas sp. TaxID=1892382 RepID=UPI0028856411|nr:hypothetical protein [Endozoicomonas sp.]